mgnify:CR=1 FL=1
MGEVLSIRVPRRLKREIEELKEFVDWKKEIIEFLEERVKYYRRLMVLRRVSQSIERHPELPEGFASRSVREDRDSS